VTYQSLNTEKLLADVGKFDGSRPDLPFTTVWHTFFAERAGDDLVTKADAFVELERLVKNCIS
jgi:hypothetical protein